MPHTTHNTTQSLRSSTATGSRQSSANSTQRFWESGNSSGAAGGGSASFFAMSASFVNGLGDMKHIDSSISLRSNKKWTPKRCPPLKDSNSRIYTNDRLQRDESQPDESQLGAHWTASERAQHVAKDKDLQDLLLIQVEKAGVVTAAGYRAVHQNFLYSDVVDQAMINRRRGRSKHNPSQNGLRNSRFGGLVKSAFGQDCSSQPMTKKRSDGSDVSRKLYDADIAFNNIAPRRSQFVTLTPEQRGEILQIETRGQLGRLQRRRESMLASIENMCDAKEDDCAPFSGSLCSQDLLIFATDKDDKAKCLPASVQHERRESIDSLILDDIFGMDGSQFFSSLASEKLPEESNASLDGLTATSTTLSRLDTLSDQFLDVNFDPEPSNVNTNSKGVKNEDEEDADLKSSAYSVTDKCGWLPWPEKKEDESSNGNSCQEQSDGSFMPWPGVPKITRNKHARAA